MFACNKIIEKGNRAGEMCGANGIATVTDEMPMPKGFDETMDLLGGAITSGEIRRYYDRTITVRVHRCRRHIPTSIPQFRASLVFIPKAEIEHAQ